MFKVCITDDNKNIILDIIDMELCPDWSIKYSSMFNSRIYGYMPLTNEQSKNYAINYYRSEKYTFRDGTLI